MKNRFFLLIAALFVLSAISCSNKSADKTAPHEVSSLTAAKDDGEVQLSWIDPADSDLDHVVIEWTNSSNQVKKIKAGTGNFAAKGLINGQQYLFSVKTVDTSGNISAGILLSTTSGSSDSDIIKNVTNLVSTAGSSHVSFTWTDPVDPADSAFTKIRITYFVSAGGDAAYTEINPGVQAATISSLTNGVSYTFLFQSFDLNGDVSSGISLAAIASSVDVSSFTATAGISQAALSWTPPADIDYVAKYRVTFTPEVSGITQPVEIERTLSNSEITGLENGVEYTFTIKCVDYADGESAGVTAKATPDGTAPAPVSNLTAAASDAQVVLNWTEPSDADYSGQVLTFTPAISSVTQPIALAKGTVSYAITGLANGTTYTFSIVTHDVLGNSSQPVTVSGTPINVAPGIKRSYTVSDGTTPVTFKLAYVPNMKFKSGTANDTDASVTSPYSIGETEVTYELYMAVYNWAVSNGYTFGGSATQGSGGTGTVLQPATSVIWRDAAVWCNALTEYYNYLHGTTLDCVYYMDAECTTPRRISSGTSILYKTAGDFDNPIVKAGAKGFRLPTGDEWELAARYITDADGDGCLYTLGEYYLGKYMSGNDPYTIATMTSAQKLAAFDAVAWYSVNSAVNGVQVTHDVALKQANALGLYDMNGNAWEWCFDWYNTTQTLRLHKGGSFGNTQTGGVFIAFLRGLAPSVVSDRLSFRIAKSE